MARLSALMAVAAAAIVAIISIIAFAFQGAGQPEVEVRTLEHSSESYAQIQEALLQGKNIAIQRVKSGVDREAMNTGSAQDLGANRITSCVSYGPLTRKQKEKVAS